MRVIKATIPMLESRTLVIGFQAENQRTQVRIDCAPIFAEYPHATPSLAIKPPAGETYPVFLDRDGDEVVWTILSENLALHGDGEIQLTFVKDNVIVKTVIGHIRILRSLIVNGEMPDPVAQWIDNANRKLAEVDAQIVELEGMVDTATDAATRAEQSASTASTAAEQAAGSAATATEKATEATNAAGTATAKAAEAQTAAQTATEKANAAAESERIATAKAAEAAQSAQTAAQKAEQITEAAQIATGKAEEASASATAAHASATDAASSATAASASETAAKASETAASTSASQAAQSVLDAGANAQTAMQKAAEATQSATNAATSATNAATSAETASTKAGEAAQSAQAVAETAEQLADSLEQIEQNTQDIAELDERKANIDGYYPDMTVGNAEQLNSSKYVENSEPYTLRTSGGTSDIGNREYLDAVVGGTVAWNQMVRDEASENSTDFADIVTVDDAVEDAAGVKVKIEPVQDLHGYDHPWPAGGGKNLIDQNRLLEADDWAKDSDGFYYGTRLAVSNLTANGFPGSPSFKENTTYVASMMVYNTNVTSGTTVLAFMYTDGTFSQAQSSSQTAVTVSVASDPQKIISRLVITFGTGGNTIAHIKNLQLEESSTATAYEPYSNICPITGWDGVKVTRTGKNLLKLNWGNYVPSISNGEMVNVAGFSSDFILIDSAKSYVISIDGDTVERYVLFYDKNKRYLGYVGNVTTGYVLNGYAQYSDAGFVKVRVGTRSSTDEFAAQLESGTTLSSYEPYAGQTYSITLPTEAGTVYGGELTVNADGSGSLVVDRVIVDMGELSWVFMNVNGTQRLCSVSLNPLPLTPKSDYYFPEIICSAYKVERVSQLPNEPYCVSMGFSGYGYGNRLIVNDEAITTVEQATEKLSGQTCVYKLLAPITYTLTPTEIRTLLGTNNVWADAGQVALTYTGTDEHLTLESGKKYLTRISGTDSMLLGSGQEITAAKGTDNVFDLTQMFGTAVADYVYGQGAAFFRKWFPNAVYPYNAGELRHVEGLQSHDMVGFNLLSDELIDGLQEITKTSSGWVGTSVNWLNSTRNTLWQSIPHFEGAAYCLTVNVESVESTWVRAQVEYTDGSYFGGNQIMQNASGTTMVISNPNQTIANLCLYYGSNGGNNVKVRSICISLAHNGSRNGEYEPYEKHSYPLDSTVILRGIPQVGANGVYWDGDRYLPDGTVERRYGVVDMGTLNWAYGDNSGRWGHKVFYADVSGRKVASAYICGKYTYSNTSISLETFPDKSYGVSSNSYAYIRDDSFTNAAAFKAAVQGALLLYELETPTTETAQPYHSTQWVSDWGTEEFVSTGIVPVGTETRYPANLRDKLQHLPDAASGNGSYLITQTDGQMVLTPFPAPPSTAGNYVLKATVTNGVATYTWEVAT